MLIQATHVLEFAAELEEFLSEVFTTFGGGKLQEAPAWLEHHSYFPLAQASGWITPLVPVASTPAPEVPPAPPAQDPQPAPASAPDLSGATVDAPVDPSAETDEEAVDDGTLDVKSLAARISKKVGETLALLKANYGVTLPNGSALVEPALFDTVIADTQKV